MKRLGYDLEYAVKDSNNVIRPAGVTGCNGLKGFPEQLKYGGVEVDCCALEITPPPALNEDDFVSNILLLLEEVKSKYSQYTLVTKPSHRFNVEDVFNVPHALTMGCCPDYNAWTGRMNRIPSIVGDLGFRSFGGHIHVEGGTNLTIKAMDLILGTWSVLKDTDKDRRKLYGKAGAFRTKSYGVEYRVLSNFWCDDENLIREVYKLTRASQSLSKEMVTTIVKTYGGPRAVQTSINLCRSDLAKEIHESALAMVA